MRNQEIALHSRDRTRSSDKRIDVSCLSRYVRCCFVQLSFWGQWKPSHRTRTVLHKRTLAFIIYTISLQIKEWTRHLTHGKVTLWRIEKRVGPVGCVMGDPRRGTLGRKKSKRGCRFLARELYFFFFFCGNSHEETSWPLNPLPSLIISWNRRQSPGLAQLYSV